MNDFDRSELEALKARVDLTAVMREAGLALKPVGKNLMARCPFHDDAEASLSVNPEAQLWNCFGCEAGGDVLSFLERSEKLTFPKAVARLRELVGSVPEPPANQRQETDRLPGGLVRSELLERVATLYAERFKETPKAQQYMTGRGLGQRELWEAFHIGYADGSLLETVPREGEVREALLQLGVLTRHGRELFDGCVVIPLTHPDQGVVGLYGRKISERAKVRHLYLPGPKRGALNWQALKADDTVVVAESILDALSFWVAGVRNVSSLFGAQSLPKDLEALLGRYAVRTVVLALDADAAGRQAVQRLGAPLAAAGLRLFTVELEPGKDPNQVLTESGAEVLRSAPRRPLLLSVAPEKPAAQKLEKMADGFEMTLDELGYRVTPRPPFGGRMRVMLCAARGSEKFLDTLDLYSHRARATAINQVHRRFGVSREQIETHFLRLLEAAEDWAAALLEAQETESGEKPAVPEMSIAEREAALEFLRAPKLVDRILEDFGSLGYVGEDNGKLLAYLIGLSRKLDKPLSGIILSQSGAGKSGLTEVVERLTPPEDVVLYSRISAQALGYLPKDFLKRKLLILEERVGGEAADYSIRVLQSRQKLTQAVVVKDPATGRMRTRHFEVEGPIAYLETTTDPRLNYENATRCFEIHLDESEEQTRRVHERQRQARTFQRLSTHSAEPRVAERHHHAQRLLEPMKVLIPYVHLLSFPTRWLRTRRDNERFLCLVEAVAFLHQHQRRRGQLDTPNGPVPYIEASLEDYDLAYQLAREVLRVTLHELSRNARDLWGAIQEWASREAGNPFDLAFSRRDLRSYTGWPDRRLREAFEELVDMEYLAVLSGSQGRAYQYKLLSVADEGPSPLSQLTTPESLRTLWKEARQAQRSLG